MYKFNIKKTVKFFSLSKVELLNILVLYDSIGCNTLLDLLKIVRSLCRKEDLRVVIS